MKLDEALKDVAFKEEYDKALETAVKSAVLESENTTEGKLKEEYDKGAAEGVKSYKAKLSSKGISTKKVDKPSCFGKYPKEANRTCRSCTFAQACRKKSKK